jgi:uncharacterized protein YndB with AHSA1/START domain
VTEGTIAHHDARVTYRYERSLCHPVDVTWKAITDPDEVERWTGNRPEIDLRPGGNYISHHRGGQRVVDRITRMEQPRLLEHTFWVHINPTARVTWELSPVGNGCQLVLTHALDIDDVRTASNALGDDVTVILSRNGAGWHRLLDKLAETLNGQSTAWSEEDQKALQERYAAML